MAEEKEAEPVQRAKDKNLRQTFASQLNEEVKEPSKWPEGMGHNRHESSAHLSFLYKSTASQGVVSWAHAYAFCDLILTCPRCCCRLFSPSGQWEQPSDEESRERADEEEPLALAREEGSETGGTLWTSTGLSSGRRRRSLRSKVTNDPVWETFGSQEPLCRSPLPLHSGCW